MYEAAHCHAALPEHQKYPDEGAIHQHNTRHRVFNWNVIKHVIYPAYIDDNKPISTPLGNQF